MKSILGKRLLPTALAALILTVINALPVAAAPESEPNDVLGMADPFSVTGLVTGIIAPGGDVDWFRVDIPATGQWQVSLVNPPATLRGEIVFYDRHARWMNVYASAINDGDDVYLDFQAADPGTYFVRFRNLNGAEVAGTYSLTSSFVPAPDTHEPSRHIGQASLLGAPSTQGYLFPGSEEDWYRIYATAGATLSFSVAPPAQMRPQIAVYGPDLNWLNSYQSAANAGDTVNLDHLTAKAGFYYVRVLDELRAGEVAPYTLSVGGGALGFEPNEPAVVAEAEANGTLSQANRIDLNTAVTGTIGEANDGDWFTFVPAQLGQLTLSLAQTAPNLSLRMRLFNDSGSQVLVGQAGLAGGLFSMTYEIISLTRHYLYIDNLDPAFSASPYRFATSLDVVADPYEPNDDYGDATVLDQTNQIEAYTFAAGDVDWYRVHVSNPGELSVTVGLLPANLAPRIAILNLSRNTLSSRNGSPGVDLNLEYPIAVPGDYLITISAANGGNLSTDPYTLTVSGADFANFAPEASIDAIDPGAIIVGDQVQFSGSGTDPDGTVAAYEWRSNIDGLLSSQANFQTSALSVGTHTISFRVRDNGGLWSTAKSELLYVGSTVSEEVEPNGAFFPANEVALNRPLTAKIDPAGDVDFFKVYIPTPGRLLAQASNVPTNLQLELVFYGPHWDWLNIYNSAASVGDDVTLGIDIATPGFYYLKVRDLFGQSNDAFVYTLNFPFTPVLDAFEPNNQLLHAALLPAASLDAFAFPGGEEDWFKVWVTAGSTLVAGINSVPADLRMNVSLYGRNREWLNRYDTSVNNGDPISAQYEVGADGFYFIRVKAESGARNWTDSYHLTVSGGQPGYVPPFVPSTTEHEDNDVIADCNPVALGTTIHGAITPANDPDWFCFDMPTPGMLHVDLDPVPAPLRARVRVRKDDTAVIDSRDATNPGDPLSFDVSLTEPGRYHVSVEGIGSTTSPENYALSLAATAVVDPHEPNNAFQDAVVLSGINRVQPYLFGGGDLDWFRVASTAGSTLRVTCADVPADLQPQIEIYDHSGNRLASKRASNLGQEISLSVAIGEDADYSIRVSEVSSRFSLDPYTLVIDGAVFSSYVPVAIIDSIAPSPADTGVPVTLSGHGEDQDGSILAYRWRSSLDGVFSISQVASGIATLTPGMHTIHFSVRDNAQNWSPETSTILFVGPTPSEQEPNDIAGSATPLDLDRPYTGMMDHGSDHDWYRITLPGPGRLTIQATHPLNTAMRTELTMYTPDLAWANVYNSASNDGDTVTLNWDLAEAGHYYLRLRDLLNRQGGEYTVTATLQVAADPFEPNHDFDHAAAVSPDDQLQAYILPGGDHDWYQVTVATPGSLVLSLTDAPSNLRLELAAYGRNREWLNLYASANNDGDDVFLTLDLQEPGTYFVRLRETRAADNPFQPYTLTTQFTPTPDAYEPNDSLATAPELVATPIQAYAFPRGNEDFYKFYAGGSAALEIVADNVAVNLRLELALYDRNGSWMNQYASSPLAGDPVTLNFGPASGYYYLRVRDVSNERSPGQPYRLTISGADLGGGPVELPAVAESEPNNDRGTATLIGTATVTGSLSDDDWFRIVLAEPSQITARIAPSSVHRVGVRLYNDDGQLLATRIAENKGDINEMVFAASPVGTYFLRIRDEDGTASANPYSFDVSLAPAADTSEPNNQFHQAAAMTFGAPVQGYVFPAGDADFYALEVPGAGVVSLELTGIDPGIEARLQVFDNNYATVLTLQNLNAGEPLQATFSVGAAGLYRVLVQDRDSNAYALNPYTLTAYFTPAVDANEPNDLWRDATPLAARNQVSGMVHPAGDTDWFRFDVAQAGQIRLQLAECAGINPYLALYNDSGTRLASLSARNVAEDLLLTYNIVEPDTYYVVVADEANNQASTSPYILTIEGGQFDDFSPLAGLRPSLAPNPALPSEAVIFTGEGSDEDGPVVGYEWTSDLDGLLSTARVATVGGLRPGTHRIGFRVRDAQGNWSARVHRNQIVADPILSESEYNNDVASAMPIPLDTWLTGGINPGGDLDYYKIFVDRCGILEMELDAVPALMKGEIILYGPNGEWLNVSASARNDGERVDLSASVNPGWYHVRVRDLNSRSLAGTYALRCGFSPAGDRYEPNGDFITATTSGVPLSVTDATICPAGDHDWFRLDIPAAGRLQMHLTNVPEAMVGEIVLYDQNFAWMNIYQAGYRGGDYVNLGFDADVAQTIYVRIRDIQNRSHAAPYSFDVEFTPVPDAHEPNDSGGTATLISASPISGYLFAPGDEDWFRIFMDSGQTLNLALTGVPSLMSGELAMYGPNLDWQNVYQTANNVGDHVYLTFTAPRSGMFYLRVKDSAGRAHTAPYQLSVTGGHPGVEPPFVPRTSESEPNASFADATDIALDTTVSGTIDPANESDYFRIWLNAPGVLTAAHTSIPAAVTSEMWIYGPGLSQVGYRRTTNPGEDNLLEVAAPTAGYHYIRVKDQGSNNASTDPYALRVHHVPVVDSHEPNDQWGQATALAGASVSGYLFPTGDLDHFRVFVRSPGLLSLSLDSVPAANRPRLRILDGNGTSRGSYVNTNPGVGGDDLLTYAVPEQGFYTIIVNDQDGNYASEPYSLRVTGADFSGAPDLQPIGDRVIDETISYRFTITATDPDNPQDLVFSASGMPPGATFDPATRAFEWTPLPGQAGSYPGVHFEVTDGNFSDSEDITISVTRQNSPPVLDPIGDQLFLPGFEFVLQISASDPDSGDVLTYSARNLPSGSSFDPASRTFRWTPARNQARVYPDVVFEATDGTWTAFEYIDLTVQAVTATYEEWRSSHFTPAQLADPAISGDDVDIDGDGVTNINEYSADTDPVDPDSYLRITSFDRLDSSIEIAWKGGVNAIQYIQFNPDLTSGEWSTVFTNEAPTPIENSTAIDQPLRRRGFYRIIAERR